MYYSTVFYTRTRIVQGHRKCREMFVSVVSTSICYKIVPEKIFYFLISKTFQTFSTLNRSEVIDDDWLHWLYFAHEYICTPVIKYLNGRKDI